MIDWKNLKTDVPAFKKAYIEFMYDKNNICNCSECPENPGVIFGKPSNTLFDGRPCGQQNCWVTCHVNHDC